MAPRRNKPAAKLVAPPAAEYGGSTVVVGSKEVLRSKCADTVDVSTTSEVLVSVFVVVVIVVVSDNGTNFSGLITTKGALRLPATADWLLPWVTTLFTVSTIWLRNVLVYNCSAIAFAEEPSGTVEKALILIPVAPAGRADANVDEFVLPNKSTIELADIPSVSAMPCAHADCKSAKVSSLRLPKARFMISTEMRTEAPLKQLRLPRHGVQSVLRLEPSVKVHVPREQMLQLVDWKPSDQVPDGQLKHAATPGTGLNLPGSQLMQRLRFACPRAG